MLGFSGQRLETLGHMVSVDLGEFTLLFYLTRAKVKKVGVLDPKGYSVDIELNAGRLILATITRKSLANLNLEPGQLVYAHIKAIKMVKH